MKINMALVQCLTQGGAQANEVINNFHCSLGIHIPFLGMCFVNMYVWDWDCHLQ